jgi:hypothetical protein
MRIVWSEASPCKVDMRPYLKNKLKSKKGLASSGRVVA